MNSLRVLWNLRLRAEPGLAKDAVFWPKLRKTGTLLSEINGGRVKLSDCPQPTPSEWDRSLNLPKGSPYKSPIFPLIN